MTPVKKIFPAVGDYAEALANPEGRFASLEGVRALADAEGGPLYVSGTGRVTFRIELDGEPCELTCFTSAGACASAERYGRVRPDEVYVFNHDGEGSYYPVAVRPVSAPAGEDAVIGDGNGELCEGLRVIVRDGLFGYADENGRVAIGPQYAWAGDFSEGRAAVAVVAPAGGGHLMGLIDRDGHAVIPPEYDDLSWDGSRYATVDKGGRHGCLDRTGCVAVPLEYDWIGEFSNGFAVVGLDGRYGYVDEKGVLAGEGLAYDDARSVAEDGTAEVLMPGSAAYTAIRLF